MKTAKMSTLFLVTALISSNIFAQTQGTLSVSDDTINKKPSVHCKVIKDKGSVWHPTKITLKTDGAMNFDTSSDATQQKKESQLDNLPVTDIQTKYFKLVKDPGKEGAITYHTNNKSSMTCKMGKGHDRTQYTH